MTYPRLKYRNKPTVIDGLRFDSKAEAKRWQELKLLERAGEIKDLERQVRYPLIVNNEKICDYVCDFQFKRNGRTVTEDVKGVRTDVYRLKKKLMAALWGIDIEEVRVR